MQRLEWSLPKKSLFRGPHASVLALKALPSFILFFVLTMLMLEKGIRLTIIINELMFGRLHVTIQENELLFLQVQDIIVKSGRFVQDAQPLLI